MKTKKSIVTESKKVAFFEEPNWSNIVQNIKGCMVSDSSLAALLDLERVLDESNIYAFKNWELGELVDGPIVKRYETTATFMWPRGLMPDPRGAKRLLSLGCDIKFKKTIIKVPIKIKTANDFDAGTNYPKLVKREVWLVNITVPKDLMSDIRQGTVDIAGQTVDLEDLDTAYERDYDKVSKVDGAEGAAPDNQGMDMGMGMPPAPEAGMGMGM